MADLLIRCNRSGAARVLSAGAPPEGGWQCFDAVETDECCLFGRAGADPAGTAADALRHHLGEVVPATSIVRLDPLLEVPGASSGTPAAFRYVVETDVAPEGEVEFNRWYDDEHLPGLAAVPGTVHASRYRDPESRPRYHACYDIATSSTVGGPPWIAVRATPWIGRVRPTFRNTTRTLFRRRSA